MITTTAFHFSWEFWEWAYYWVMGITSTLARLTHAVPSFPSPSDAYTWQYVVIYFLLSSVPHILSQQAVACALIPVAVLSNALTMTESEITAEGLQWKGHGRSSREDVERALAKLKQWEQTHSKILRLNETTNSFFGPVFLLVYTIDIMIGLSLASWSLTAGSDLPTYAVFLCGFAIFCSYAVIIPIPLIHVFEQVTLTA
ncbi:hypothetical protein BV898_17576 [Hypsibius exemplaris]|uniref:Uncharacterized protein n=1 Tax=Hypsibius exemplaris TaxID=2072580 RepID=A0A9X6NMI4_HYPEX|nr:hypothetical protein BV898_17576 [Hypsibius exemplaris]